MQTLFLTNALLPHGWARDVLVMLTPDGRIASLVSDSVCPPHAERLAGAAIAAIPNLHSHAHQRAIAGLAEHSGDRPDTFWTWREVMYRALDRMDPNDFEVVATQLYVEMAKAGFTAVAEFHYLHHDRDGRHYSDPAELGHRAIAAARTAGVAITLPPVLYASSGFGGTAPTFSQRRFIHDALSFSEMIASLRSAYRLAADVRIGIAPHSLRAVPPNLLAEVASVHDSGPIHIHVAERKEEVEECLVHTGCRPVEWLLENHDIDSRWCLVHATHVTPAEIAGMAQRGVIVGLCPTTEGNLGDGIFPAEYFLACRGRFGIESDSHILVNPVEELRWLEYAMRLGTGRRKLPPFDEVSTSVCAQGQGPHAMRTGLARVAAVREAVGPNARIMVDCHWRFDEATARQLTEAAGRLWVYWIECPLPEVPDNIPALARLRRHANALSMLQAGLEMGIGWDSFRPYCEGGAYDVVMPDMKYAGGIHQMQTISAGCGSLGVQVSPHNPSGPICHAASLQVSATLDAFDMLELQFDESPLFDSLVRAPYGAVLNGQAVLPAGSGLGVALDEPALTRHAQRPARSWSH